MKVLEFIDVYLQGGAEKIYNNLATFCNDSQIDILQYCFFGDNSKITCFFPKTHNNFICKLYEQIVAIFKLRKIIKNQKIDYIVAFLERSNLTAIYATIFLKTKIIVNVLNPPQEQYKKLGIFRLFILKIISFSYNNKRCRVFTICKQLKNSLNSMGVSKVEIIYNPVINTSQSENLKIEPSNYFLTVGRFEYQKGFWKAIKAYKLLKDKIGITNKLIMLGTGKLLDSHKELVKTLNLENDILFLGYKENINQLILNSICLVFPSYFEGFSVTIMQAALMNKLCVGTKIAIPLEFQELTDYSPFLYENKNLDENFSSEFQEDDYELMNILNNVLRDNEIVNKITSKCKSWSSENCNLSTFAKYFYDLQEKK